MSEIISNELPYEKIQVTPSLELRQLTLSDAERTFYLVDLNRDYLSQWLPWAGSTLSVEDSKEFIRKMIESRKDGSEYGYAIVVDRLIMGHMSIMHLNDGEDPEIGYWIASEASGKGTTTVAANALTEFGFNVLKLPKIVIKADQGNIPSNKVAEKLGYKIEKTERSRYTNQLANVWSRTSPVPE